ncbi:MAG: alginate lyase family protein [Opitutaceae bacterium]|jgi:hypothetical protein|nr:alginate lyase family protein [Opitutaceae bacterium]
MMDLSRFRPAFRLPRLMPPALALLATAIPPARASAPWLLDRDELATLAAAAPAALHVPITTVVEKTRIPHGCDPHDFVSYARYWWPDPARPDGLPWIRRDGDVNHAQFALGDDHRILTLARTVEKLAAAWRLNRDEPAALRAGEWLRAWFITPATRMYPHMDFAQIRPGHNRNRGNPAGVLDSRCLAQVIDALRLLDDSPALTPPETASVKAWFRAMFDWLSTAKNALAERAMKNNHGTWFLAQIIPIARYCGRDDLARQFCDEAKNRIAFQIKPDGSQPEELTRADALGYSLFNLRGHAQIARHAARFGDDLWSWSASNGASLRRAIDYLRPYNDAPRTWPGSQKAPLPPGFLTPLIKEAAAAVATKAIMPDA